LHENPDNIITTCSNCAKQLYPNKGKWAKRDMKFCTHVKKDFNNEHMWVEITRVKKDGVEGTVVNIPIFENSPTFGTKVFVKYEEIEDVC